MRPYYLLDTNIISEIFRPKPDKKVFNKLIKYENLCAIPSTTWNELLYGVNLMEKGNKKDFIFSKLIDDIQSNFPVIQYDSHTAWIHADIRSRLKEKNITIDFQDTQIASIAVANSMVLVSRNLRHFEPMKEVTPLLLENWFE